MDPETRVFQAADGEELVVKWLSRWRFGDPSCV